MELNNIINNLAEKLGTTAEYLLPIMTRAKFTEGLMGFITTSIILLVLASFALTKLKGLTFEKLEKMDGDTSYCTFGTIVVIFSISAITIALWRTSVLQMSSPEYYAIKELLSLVGGKQ